MTMKDILIKSVAVAAISLMAARANAQTGNPYIHDPSTIVECD